MTTYFAVVAPGGCFKAAESTSLADVKDHHTRTLIVVEVSAKHAVHWMSPQDATEEMILNRETDGEFSHPSGSQAAFVDGHIEYLMKNVRADVLRALISIDGKDDDVATDHL
jgi:prepilin-type processing-associated H-X9-DG protein